MGNTGIGEVMEIKELQGKLQGVYDLTDAVDCQSVIRMLLRDLDAEKQKAEFAGKTVRMLAEKVKAGDPDAKELAEKVIQNAPKKKHSVMDFMQRMCDSMDAVEGLSDEKLVDEAIHLWAEYNMDSKESSVLDELIHRFRSRAGIRISATDEQKRRSKRLNEEFHDQAEDF
jgi:hypothetical protein